MNNDLPPFWVWLYGRVTQKNAPVFISPADAWRKIESMLGGLPRPNGWFQSILCFFAKRNLIRLRDEYLKLDNARVTAVGVLPFSFEAFERAVNGKPD